MKADEARKISNENLRGPVIEPYMEVIWKRILKAAGKGQRSIHGRHQNYPNIDKQKAIIDRLRQDGYEVNYHPDPDPGHPCSSSYYTIEW